MIILTCNQYLKLIKEAFYVLCSIKLIFLPHVSMWTSHVSSVQWLNVWSPDGTAQAEKLRRFIFILLIYFGGLGVPI